MTELRAVVFHSWGTWVALCPRPWCVHADHYGPGPNTGRLGGLGRDTFTCLRCGLVCPADWPHNRADIETVLAQRPMRETRNWLPGETLVGLVAENAAHGLIEPTGLTGGMLSLDDNLTDLGRLLVSTGPIAIGGQ
jgi:hypothetical protein